MVVLYHFTSPAHMYGIAKHGLTVGDVPTNIASGKGEIGVWLTSDLSPAAHGLNGSVQNKRRLRLTVLLPDDSPKLVKWTHWAQKHATPATIAQLHATASGYETWFVYFDVVHPKLISEVIDMTSGSVIADWRDAFPKTPNVHAVPPWHRRAWQKRMLRDVGREARRRN